MSDKLLVIGAGGHARSVLDIALQNNNFAQIACMDPVYPKLKKVDSLDEIPIIGTDDDMQSIYEQGYKHVFVALGENKLRHKLFHTAVSIGFEPVNIISSGALVSPRANLGRGVCVMAGAIININTTIDDNCIINTRSSIDHDCHIMKSCHIAPGATLSGCVKLEQGVWIGTGASIVEDIVIEEWSFIGAGAVVINDVEANALYYGTPARKIKQIV